MNYDRYRVEDFVLDEAFRQWVLHPDKTSNFFWSRWLDEHPRKAATLMQAIALIRELPVQQDNLTEQQRASLSQAIEEGIDQMEATGQQPKEDVIPISAYAITQQKLTASQSGKHIPFRLVKIAAGIILVLGMLYFMFQGVLQPQQVSDIAYEQVVKENPKGQRMTVFLSDGSKVILNAGSQLSFTKPFQPDRRIVNLEGEAFFEVAKDALRPFQVITGSMTTTALGTSFNVTAYPEDDQVKVSLATGKVKINDQHAERGRQPTAVYYLTPGAQITYHKARHIFTQGHFDTEEVLAWKEGVIYLKKADQARVTKTLERWYGIQIITEGKSTVPWEITAKFNNQSLKSVLTSLSYTLGFTFEIKEDHVFIKYS